MSHFVRIGKAEYSSLRYYVKDHDLIIDGYDGGLIVDRHPDKPHNQSPLEYYRISYDHMRRIVNGLNGDVYSYMFEVGDYVK